MIAAGRKYNNPEEVQKPAGIWHYLKHRFKRSKLLVKEL
jgi:hypothetical protein